MTAFSNLRQNPWTAAFSNRVMDPEIHTISEFDELPGVFGIQLQDRPVQGTVVITTNNTAATPYTEVTTTPLAGQYRVDYVRGLVQFASSEDGNSVEANYSGRGSNLTISLIQQLIGIISSTFSFLTASTSSGIQMRANDNTTVSAVFGAGGTSDMEVGNKIRARTSAGILVEASNGTDVVTFGAGNTSASDFGGPVNVAGVLSPNGRVAFPSGTASAPSIYPTGDDNTGIYPIGADELGIATGGAERARFGSYGVRAPGLIIQSVYSANSFQTTTTGVVYTDVLSAIATTWEITITPKSAASVINLFANLQVSISRSAVSHRGGVLIQRKIGAGAYTTIFTPLTDATGPYDIFIAAGGSTGVNLNLRHTMMIRDTPATTSAVSYKFQIRNRESTNSPTITVNEDATTDGQSFVILNEVAV